MNTIVVPVRIFRDLLQMATATHKEADCECESEILAPARGLLTDYEAAKDK